MNHIVAEPILGSYDRVLVAFSGGKDCTAALLDLLDRGVSPDKIELHHHDVDGGQSFMDWPITPAYCRAVAAALGIPIYFSWKEGGFWREMTRDNAPTAPTRFETPEGVLGQVGGQGVPGTRGLFPQVSANLSHRWCSSYLKIDVMDRVLCNGERFNHSRTLVITGERAEESANRANYARFEAHRADNRNSRHRRRHIDHWRPVHSWVRLDVWAVLQRYGLITHPAYALGWGRLSCMSCIFGSADQWATIQVIAPEHFERIADREEWSGKTIQRTHSVRELASRGTPYAAALANPELVQLAMSTDWGDRPVLVEPSAWRLPAGAYGESAGPT